MYIADSRTKTRCYKWLTGLALFVVLLALLSVNASGSSVHETNTEQAECFREEAPAIIRQTLEGHLYLNCGIMLMASFENEYVTGFTVMISNKNFAKLNDISKQVLSSELQKVMMDVWDACRPEGTAETDETECDDSYPTFSVILN